MTAERRSAEEGSAETSADEILHDGSMPASPDLDMPSDAVNDPERTTEHEHAPDPEQPDDDAAQTRQGTA